MSMSVSFVTSSKMTSLKHNNRELTEKEFEEPAHRHINSELSQYNIYLKQENLKEVYDEKFGPALERYNAKQKRSDRKIQDYFHHVKKSKTLDLQREFIVTLGTKDDWEYEPHDVKLLAGDLLAEYVENFAQRHPHLYIYNAVIHLDEAGAPHAHFNVVPLATGYKNGLEVQPSFKKALANEGYVEQGRGLLKEFRDKEVAELEKALHQLGYTRRKVGTNDIKDVREYKNVMKQVEKLTVEKEKLEETIWELTGKKLHLLDKIDQLEQTKEKLVSDFAEELDQAEKEVGRFVDDLIWEHKHKFPSFDNAQDKLAGLLKATGSKNLEEVALRFWTNKLNAEGLGTLLENVKEVLQGVNLANALQKAKKALELVVNYTPMVLSAERKEHLIRSLNASQPRSSIFHKKLDNARQKQKEAIRGQIRASEREIRKEDSSPRL